MVLLAVGLMLGVAFSLARGGGEADVVEEGLTLGLVLASGAPPVGIGLAFCCAMCLLRLAKMPKRRLLCGGKHYGGQGHQG